MKKHGQMWLARFAGVFIADGFIRCNGTCCIAAVFRSLGLYEGFFCRFHKCESFSSIISSDSRAARQIIRVDKCLHFSCCQRVNKQCL